ncbi:MAG: TIM barrel protein [Prolixibacteraceae bacterium]|jgi:sugar phosphate isomerase/epimerase|nr:TIM barrel protein [Prolixibacteraceae bacterium]MBT6006293.1 TIM barrel protein [Prolixibacteraceae bacterium]MBT6764040.1 TIM barrel protein [Prolixibacteraceae bacterium]MBT6998832.1 TIM barrel protein [Prolixibacteraceae bacterium]MBT7395193.1 TIM barrel protein [Prolixibacteraceae bacterium]
MENTNRRKFLKTTLAASAGTMLISPALAGFAAKKSPFKISLAEWSLHKTLFANKMTNLEFPVVTRELGIEAVEYVNQFFKDKARDEKYLAELKKIAKNEGVTNVLIMCDGEGMMGHPEKAERIKTVENHKKWVDAAEFLACHSIRVNAGSRGEYDEQQKLAADGLRMLCEYGDTKKINIIVENHGGLSSNGNWLAGVMKMVDHKRVGTLPDFGNFVINRQTGEEFDRYKGVELLMPFAKGVSAKSHDFDSEGNETKSDFYRLMQIVKDSGYKGYVDVEYEGSVLSEKEGIIATRKLLEKVFKAIA